MSPGDNYIGGTSVVSRPIMHRGAPAQFQTYSSAAAPIEAPISEITALDVVCAVVAVLVATASGVGFAVSIFYFLFI